ncbi:MAG TPA: hypothetical protein VE175_04575 [Woeseiaceae bacterium]|nr:hypothetical protein [Woeseiaceae bacterium]
MALSCSADCSARLRQDYRITQYLQEELAIRSRGRAPVSMVVYSLFGIVLLAAGLYVSLTRPGLDYVTLAMSAVFFVMAGAAYRNHRAGCASCRI